VGGVCGAIAGASVIIYCHLLGAYGEEGDGLGKVCQFSCNGLEHDPEKWIPVFPRDKRGTRLRGDHAQTKR
jgi:hypothetical protein